jgi:hypothetical protein
MYYLLRDETLIQIGNSPEAIVSEVNRALANFRTYGGLNFVDENIYFVARYGTMTTNLKVRWDKPEEKEAFEKVVTVNF